MSLCNLGSGLPKHSHAAVRTEIADHAVVQEFQALARQLARGASGAQARACFQAYAARRLGSDGLLAVAADDGLLLQLDGGPLLAGSYWSELLRLLYEFWQGLPDGEVRKDRVWADYWRISDLRDLLGGSAGRL
jgi:hypothetical protein